MPWLLLGALAFVAFLLAGRLYRARTAPLSATLKRGAVLALSLIALAALAREQVLPALLLAGSALVVAGTHRKLLAWLKGAAQATLTSRLVSLTLDPRTGSLDGQVLGGSFAGRKLAGLALAEVIALRAECLRDDEDGARLVETYLDRRFGPGWRGETGRTEERQQQRRRPEGTGSGSAMSRDEAWAVLGLKAGASPDAIKAAHRRLMMKLHPDLGGSTYLAAKINRAREVLLGEA